MLEIEKMLNEVFDSKAQAARLLGVSRRTVQRWCNGEIRHPKYLEYAIEYIKGLSNRKRKKLT